MWHCGRGASETWLHERANPFVLSFEFVKSWRRRFRWWDREKLSKFKSFAYDKFGEVEITHKGERFCFFLSERATEYVHENGGQNQFIFDLVALLAKAWHGHGRSRGIVLRNRKMTYEIWIMENLTTWFIFDDSKINISCCFKDEGCHIYHRFYRRIMRI